MPDRPTNGRVRGPSTALLLALAAFGAGAQAQQGVEGADVELLEFLGSWELEDEDWVAVTIEDLEEERRVAGKETGDDTRAGADEDEK